MITIFGLVFFIRMTSYLWKHSTKIILVSSSSACTLVIASASLGFWTETHKHVISKAVGRGKKNRISHSYFQTLVLIFTLWAIQKDRFKRSLRGDFTANVHSVGYFVCLLPKPKRLFKTTESLMWETESRFNGETSSRVKSHLVFSEVNVQGFVIDGFRITRGPVYTVHLLGEFL